MIKAILFDMDGTLVDSERHYTTGTYKWLKENGFKGKLEDVYCIIGTTMERTYEITAEFLNTTVEETKRINDEYFKNNLIDYGKYIFDDTIETLKKLKELGMKIMICSQSNYNEVTKCINDMKINEYIDHFICSDDIDKPKPDPDIYLKAIKYLNINKDEAIIVEDSETGIKSGVSSQIYTLARKDKVYGSHQELADKIIESLIEVVDEVKRINEQ